MPPNAQQIDAISVGVGLDLRRVGHDLQRIQGEVNRTAQTARPINIPARIVVDQTQVRNFRRDIERQMRTSGTAVHVPITIRVDNQELRNFRRTLERQLRGFGQQNQGIHVPIQVANLAQFHKQIETYLAQHSVDVVVNARFRDEGKGGHGGGGAAPRGGGPGPTPAPTSGAPAAEAARNRPARGRAQQTAAPVSSAQDEVAVQRERRRQAAADLRAQQRDRAQDQREAARDRRDRQRAQQEQQPAQATSEPREQRRVRRAAEQQQRAQQASSRTLPPLESERVSTDTLRSRRAEEELTGEDRAAFIAQQRAPRGGRRFAPQRGDTAPRYQSQTGFRATAKGGERIAQAQRMAASRARVESDRDAQAREVFASDPTMQGLMDALAPTSASGAIAPSIGDISDALALAREGGATVRGYAQSGKRGRRAVARVRGTRKNFNPDYVDPSLLLYDAAISAGYQAKAVAMDPTAVVQKGDNKLRGRGGKVGRSGGFTAGRLASESVDPAGVQAMVDAGRVTKDDVAQYGRSSAQRARAILQERRPRRPGEPGNPEEGGAAYIRAGEAEPIYGGQGMSRGAPDIAKETRARESARKARAAEAELGPRPASPSPGPIPRTGRSIFGEPAPYAPGDEPGFGRTRSSRPKQNMGGGPTARNTEYQGSSRGHEYDFSGFGRAYRDARRSQGVRARTAEERRAQRIEALKNMADVSKSASPAEAEIARAFLRRYGVEGFAEGGRPNFGAFTGVDLRGSIPGRVLRQALALEGEIPRPGSRSRAELEARFKVGVRNRRKYEQKPMYQRGGNSDPRYASVRQSFIAGLGPDIRCSNCGRQIHRGSKGPDGLALDHVKSSASGGDIYDPGNFQVLCNSCNGYKSGGRSARDLRKPDPWGGERRSWEDETGMFRRADGGTLWERVQRAKAAQAGQQPQMRSTGMYDRAAQRPEDFTVTKVGEQGPEIILQDKNTGETHVVPAHKVPTWMARAQQGKGVAKDMTGRAEGGPLSIRNMGRAGQRYAAGGTLVSETAARTGDVQRVFVTNWPAGIGAGFGSLNQQAAQGRAQAPGAGGAGAPPVGTPPAGPFTPPGAPPPGRRARAGGSRDPYDRIRAREFALAGEGRAGSLEERIQGARADVQTSLQEAPVRALSVALGQIAQTAIGGRGGILSRAAAARTAAGRAQRAIGQYQGLRQEEFGLRARINDIRSGRETVDNPTETLAELRAQVAATRTGRIRAREVAEQRTQTAEERAGSILTRGQQFRAQGVGLLGIVAGTQLFTTAVAALSAAEQAASAALGPLVDQMRGWPATINAVTEAVRDNMQSANQRQGLAQSFANTGVSAAFLDTASVRNVGQIASNRAAQLRAQSTLDLTRAAAGANPNTGLFGGVGGFANTGFGTEVFGGQPGLLETIAKRLQVNRPQFNMGPADNGPLGLAPNDRAVYNAFRAGQNPPGIFGEGFVPGQTYSGLSREEFMRRFELSEQAPGRQEEVLRDLNKNLEAAATYAGESANAFKLVTGATEAQTKAMVESAKATGDAAAVQRAQEFAAAGVTVTRGGRGLAGQEFQQFALDAARGQLIDDPRTLLRQTENERRARTQRILAQGEAQRRQDLPADFALQEIARPPTAFGTSFNAGAAGLDQSSPFNQETLSNIEKYRTLATGAQQSINEEIGTGRNAILDIAKNIGPSAVSTVSGLLNQIDGIGKQITGINEGIQIRQAAFEEHSFANSIRLTERSLSDAKDLYAGIQGSVIDTVGGLQGQNILLERQNQLLSRRSQQLSFASAEKGFQQSDLQVQLQNLQFAQSQRQINFQKALAGFVAPGTTPEERAARIQEAKLVAAEAQRQLNLQIRIARLAREQLAISKQQLAISRQEFGNSNKIQDNQFEATKKEARRAIGDIQRELALLEEGHAISIDSKAAEEAIARLEKAEQRLINKTQSYINEGQQVRDAILDDVQAISAATGKAFGELIGHVQHAWAVAFRGYETRVTEFMNAMNSMAYTGTGGQSHPNTSQHTPSASGVNTRVNTPTRFLAGDAGGEQVIILRNPQEGMFSMPYGGGGGWSGVSVGGISVTVAGSVDDPERFATMIAAKVEQRLNNKLALQGAGRPLAQ